MNAEQHIKVLQTMYAGVLADSVLRMGREGILDKVTSEKRLEQLHNGGEMAKRFGITSPSMVFTGLAQIFNCADWTVDSSDNEMVATATRCTLCSMAKRLGAQSPCSIHCLDAMEGMVKGLDETAMFEVQETLWDGAQCRVKVTT